MKLNDKPEEVSVHLAHLKYHHRETPPAPDSDKLGELLLGKGIPLPEIDKPDGTLPQIESYVVEKVV